MVMVIQTVELGEKVFYRGELCEVYHFHKGDLINLKRPCGFYWHGVHPWYVTKQITM